MRNGGIRALGVILLLVCLITPIVLVVKSIKFTQNCEGYLKQAADANSVELAIERIGRALEYIEKHDMTEGYTSVIYRTEDENVGFWYQNIKTCKEELEACVDASQLEKTNVLMKVRESLTDDGQYGTQLTIPDGISRYPNNLLWGILLALSAIFVIPAFIMIFDEF